VTFFWGQKLAKNLQLCGRTHHCATRKNLESRTQPDEPAECASGGDPLLLYKILHLIFSPLVWILCALRLESRKNLSTWSRCGTFRISVSLAKAMYHQPIQNSVPFVLVSQAKHQVSSPIIILLKIFVCIGQHDNVLTRCDLTFPSLLRCQGVWNKTCTRLSLSQIRIAGWPTDSQLKSTTCTNCCTHTVYLLMMGYKYAWNMWRLTDKINWG